MKHFSSQISFSRQIRESCQFGFDSVEKGENFEIFYEPTKRLILGPPQTFSPADKLRNGRIAQTYVAVGKGV